MRLARTHDHVTALGPGKRFGIWFQGCNIGCGGCLAHETWEADAGVETSADSLIESIGSSDEYSGVSISGGEPLMQANELRQFLEVLRNSYPDLSVLLFTGHSETRVTETYSWLFGLVDALVCGPYEASQAGGEHWRGSTNQTVWFSSRVVAKSLRAWIELDGPQHLQMGTSETGVWIVGIPRPGDLTALSSRLESAGLVLENAGWRRSTAAPRKDER